MKQQVSAPFSKLKPELFYQLANVTEAAAIACIPYIGSGQRKQADQAAVTAMRNSFNALPISATVVIGEGERDEAPMLYIGEEVGAGGIKIDIAVDPLEGTNLCANALSGAITTLAAGSDKSLLNAPDIYMEKLAIGADIPNGIVDLDASVKENINNLAKFKNCPPQEILVSVLKRERHQDLVEEIHTAGAKVKLIDDGDIMACIATCYDNQPEDMYLGIGAAPEGVIAAAAIKNLGGFMQGRLLYKDETQKKRAEKMGIKNITQKFSHTDMIKDESVFIASFVTDGILPGIVQFESEIMVNTLIIHPDGEINISNIIKNTMQ